MISEFFAGSGVNSCFADAVRKILLVYNPLPTGGLIRILSKSNSFKNSLWFAELALAGVSCFRNEIVKAFCTFAV